MISATAPPAGAAQFGPADTFRTRCEAVGGAACLVEVGSARPALTTNATSNSVSFFYGDFDDPGNADTTIDILFTVTVSNEPFADGLYLTNQVHSVEGSTNAQDASGDDIVQVQLGEPVLLIKKGVLDTDNANESFSQTPAPAGFPLIGSNDLVTTPVDANVSGVNGSAIVTFAIVLENAGSSTGGAFDVRLSDVIASGFVIPPGGINLSIVRGDGRALASTPVGAVGPEPSGLFGAGIEIYDPNAPTGPVCQKYHPNDGSNIVILTYQLQVDPNAAPGQVITNTASLNHYVGTDGGPNHLGDGSGGVQPMTDSATTTLAGWNTPVKSIEATSETSTTGTNVTIGEIVRYRLAAELPEGGITNLALRDTLPAGLSLVDNTQVKVLFVADQPMTLPASRIGVSGRTYTFTLGNITNRDNDSGTGAPGSEYVILEFNALVENTSSTNRGNTKDNSFTVRTGSPAATVATSNTVRLTTVEPSLFLSKFPDGTIPDAGDTVTFSIRMRHTTASNATAFDVTLSDTLPPTVIYAGNLTTTACPNPPTTGPTESGGTITASWDVYPVGATCTITFQVRLPYTVEPGQQIFNTAQATFTSLPGTGTPGNPTGSTTPGAPGAPNGERDGGRERLLHHQPGQFHRPDAGAYQDAGQHV